MGETSAERGVRLTSAIHYLVIFFHLRSVMELSEGLRCLFRYIKPLIGLFKIRTLIVGYVGALQEKNKSK